MARKGERGRGVCRPLGCARWAPHRELAGTARPGPQPHVHTHFTQILSQRFIDTGNRGSQDYYSQTGTAGFTANTLPASRFLHTAMC